MSEQARARAVLAGAAGGAVLALGAAAWPFTVDDAYIVARYARHWAGGEGFAMNSEVVTDGVTALPWIVPGWVATKLGGDAIIVAKATGLLCAALAGALVTASASRGSVARALVVAAVLATSATLGIWAVAGLETGLAALCVAVAIALLDLRARWAHLAAGAALGLLVDLRPETWPLSLVLLAATARGDSRTGLRAAAAFVPLALAVPLLRSVAFGDPLPLSFYAKPGELEEGARYVVRGVARVTGGGGAALAAWGALRGGSRARWLGGALAAHLGAVAVAGGDWMPGHRLLAPVVPLYALLVADGVAALRVRHGRRCAALASVLLAFALAVPALDGVVQIPRAREAGRLRETRGRAVASRLAQGHAVVALLDVGYLAARSEVEVVDLGGVTDPVVAHAPGAYLGKEIDPAYLLARNPDALLLHASRPPEVDAQGRLIRLAGHPVERRVAGFPWVRERFRVEAVLPYAPDYFYVLLTARPGTP